MVIFQVINNIALDTKGGGAESFAVRLTNELNNSYECHLIVVWRFGTPEEQRIIESLKEKNRIHFLSGKEKHNHITKFFYLLQQFSSLVKQYSPVIINSHSALPDLLNCVMPFLKNGKQRIIVRTMHTNRNWMNNLVLEKIFIDCIFPLTFNCEVSISKATKTRLDARCISRIQKKSSPIIYNGIPDDVNNYQKTNQLSHKNTSSVYRIVSVGRLSEQKGFEYLLTALSILEDRKNVELVIVGEGPLRHELEQQVRLLGLEESVKFLGYRMDVLEIMSDADIFVSSSLWEGFPTVILEAMTIGLPVIATDISGSCELVKNEFSGILVPVKNPEAIAKAISLLRTHPNLTEQVITNARKCVSSYSMKTVAEAYDILYHDLIFSDKEKLK